MLVTRQSVGRPSVPQHTHTHRHTGTGIENENACHEISRCHWPRCPACDDCRQVIIRATARPQLRSAIRHLGCVSGPLLLTITSHSAAESCKRSWSCEFYFRYP